MKKTNCKTSLITQLKNWEFLFEIIRENIWAFLRTAELQTIMDTVFLRNLEVVVVYIIERFIYKHKICLFSWTLESEYSLFRLLILSWFNNKYIGCHLLLLLMLKLLKIIVDYHRTSSSCEFIFYNVFCEWKRLYYNYYYYYVFIHIFFCVTFYHRSTNWHLLPLTKKHKKGAEFYVVPDVVCCYLFQLCKQSKTFSWRGFDLQESCFSWNLIE